MPSELWKLVRTGIEHGEHELSSGATSDYYVDLKRLSGNPRFLGLAGERLAGEVRELEPHRIAAMELGGIPLLTMTSYFSSTPMIMVRKDRKEHGTEKRLEGRIYPGEEVMVMDDVSTTGKSLYSTAEAVMDGEGEVRDALVLVDRGEGATDYLLDRDILLHYIFGKEALRTAGSSRP